MAKDGVREYRADQYEITLSADGLAVSILFHTANDETRLELPLDLARRMAFDLVDSISRGVHTPAP